MKKQILVDLSILKNPHCGLGEIALNYGKYYEENLRGDEDFVLYLLLPKKYNKQFGDKVKYISVSNWYKIFPFLLPKVDVWHSIHQLNKYRPFYKSTKQLVTIHDFNFMYEKKGRKINKYLHRIQKEIDRANKICCISNFTKSEIEKYTDLKGKDVQVIYNGVADLSLMSERKPEFITDNSLFFFSIGVIKEKKNFHVLLDLMKLHPEKTLIIAGQKKGSYCEMIEDRIIDEKISNVILAGIVSNEERVWLYKNCEAFLFPSLFEGFGLPIIEALSLGKPVFSSKETSLKEIGGDCVFFWENFEANAMKDLINSNLALFYANEDLAKRNMAYAHKFSYQEHMEKYIRIYQKML